MPPEFAADLFGEAGAAAQILFDDSAARRASTFGVLALASEDAQRFYPEMGTVYLKRIGDMVATALLRHSTRRRRRRLQPSDTRRPPTDAPRRREAPRLPRSC